GGLVLLFFWLLFGDFAVSMRDRSVQPVGQLMLNKFGTSNTTMSVLLIFVPPLISMLLSPIVSYESDRFRSRWGRRIPFLLITTPVAAFSMIGMAFCPQLAHALHSAIAHLLGLKACFVIVFGTFWTGFE